MKRKVLDGKDGVCPHCGGLMIYLDVAKIGVVSQCKLCGNVMQGRVKDVIKIIEVNESWCNS